MSSSARADPHRPSAGQGDRSLLRLIHRKKRLLCTTLRHSRPSEVGLPIVKYFQEIGKTAILRFLPTTLIDILFHNVQLYSVNRGRLLGEDDGMDVGRLGDHEAKQMAQHLRNWVRGWQSRASFSPEIDISSHLARVTSWQQVLARNYGNQVKPHKIIFKLFLFY